MKKTQTYYGVVKTGRGGAVREMLKPGGLEEFQKPTGLDIIPVTLNIQMTEPLDTGILNYLKFADVGWEFDPAAQGINYNGETGVYYHRVTITREYPGCLLVFTWVTDIHHNAELVSPRHLRTVLNLSDGDIIAFTLNQ
jgi:CTP-dependent riboflavin kinase